MIIKAANPLPFFVGARLLGLSWSVACVGLVKVLTEEYSNCPGSLSIYTGRIDLNVNIKTFIYSRIHRTEKTDVYA